MEYNIFREQVEQGDYSIDSVYPPRKVKKLEPGSWNGGDRFRRTLDFYSGVE